MQRRILVVDDDERIRSLLESRLEANGYAVSVAADGREALQKAKQEQPDLALLDVMMPDMDGIELYHKMREHLDTLRIPIIFVTALRSREQQRADGLFMGNHIVFAKPFDPRELIKTIGIILREPQTHRSNV